MNTIDKAQELVDSGIRKSDVEAEVAKQVEPDTQEILEIPEEGSMMKNAPWYVRYAKILIGGAIIVLLYTVAIIRHRMLI